MRSPDHPIGGMTPAGGATVWSVSSLLVFVVGTVLFTMTAMSVPPRHEPRA